MQNVSGISVAGRAAGAGWATGIIVLPLLAIPAYLYLVVRTRVRDGRIGSLDRWIIWAYGSLVLPFGLGAILSPPDPITQLTVQLVAIPPVAIALYHFMFRHGWPGNPQTAPRG